MLERSSYARDGRGPAPIFYSSAKDDSVPTIFEYGCYVCDMGERGLLCSAAWLRAGTTSIVSWVVLREENTPERQSRQDPHAADVARVLGRHETFEQLNAHAFLRPQRVFPCCVGRPAAFLILVTASSALGIMFMIFLDFREHDKRAKKSKKKETYVRDRRGMRIPSIS